MDKINKKLADIGAALEGKKTGKLLKNLKLKIPNGSDGRKIEDVDKTENEPSANAPMVPFVPDDVGAAISKAINVINPFQPHVPTKSGMFSGDYKVVTCSIREDTKLMHFAMLCADVYDKNLCEVPYGWRVVDYDVKPSGMVAKVYHSRTYGYVCAFGGSKCYQDWKENLSQLIGMSQQYEDAFEFGDSIVKKYQKVTFVGHSQGGGEAAYCGFCLDMPVITFNPAGLSEATVNKIYSRLGDDSSKANLRKSNVHAYIFWSDILNLVQQSGNLILKSKTKGILNYNVVADGNIHYVIDYFPSALCDLHGMRGILNYFTKQKV